MKLVNCAQVQRYKYKTGIFTVGYLTNCISSTLSKKKSSNLCAKNDSFKGKTVNLIQSFKYYI